MGMWKNTISSHPKLFGLSMLVWRALVVVDQNLRAVTSFPHSVLMLCSVYIFFSTRSSRRMAGETSPFMILRRKQPVEKDTGQPVITTWEKMSKSKHNGVDPDDMLKDYGIDTTRLLILADVSPTSHRHWTVDSELLGHLHCVLLYTVFLYT
uniref:leucine--tRNA ligase n=1 Tax=Timema douglasi TaxID=61478 RepID=A0A7R8VHK8_TIMDO|nr:unnamed protein product [Timema douglasi]